MRKSKILFAFFASAVLICSGILCAFAFDPMSTINNEYKDKDHDVVIEILRNKSFNEIRDEFNTMAFNCSDYSALILHAGVLAEKVDTISDQQYVNEIENQDN
jgi:hypothetical protein